MVLMSMIPATVITPTGIALTVRRIRKRRPRKERRDTRGT
jgi:hypothetical protein